MHGKEKFCIVNSLKTQTEWSKLFPTLLPHALKECNMRHWSFKLNSEKHIKIFPTINSETVEIGWHEVQKLPQFCVQFLVSYRLLHLVPQCSHRYCDMFY